MSRTTSRSTIGDLLLLLTHRYWNLADVKGLDVGSASLGLRFGMAIAMRHPEYAQAYLKLTDIPIANSIEEIAVQEFLKQVPMEGELEDVLPSSQ